MFLGITATLVILTALLWLLVPAWYGLPPVSTRRERIRSALELAKPKAGEKLYDLGSGHGRVLVMAAREFGLFSVGIEVGPVQCIVSLINAWWNGVKPQVQVNAGNFYRSNLGDADIIFAYLTPEHGMRLGEKLSRELKSGARVVTVAFDLEGWTPEFFDRDRMIFLYRK